MPGNLKCLKGKFFRIAGWDASKVVALLSCIVNQWKINQTYYLLLDEPGCNNSHNEFEVFRLTARPTNNQPGNGIFVMRPSRHKKFPPAKKYDEITGAIAAEYESGQMGETSNQRFWEDIQKLFHNNTSVDSIPGITYEAYLLLLFEIARRLVRGKPNQTPSDYMTASKQEAFDCLPVGVAIARMLVIKPDFRKVFLKGEDFDCFSVPSPAERRNRIINVNKTFRNEQNVGLKSKEDYLAELKTAFVRPTMEKGTHRKMPYSHVHFSSLALVILIMLIVIVFFCLSYTICRKCVHEDLKSTWPMYI